MEKKRKKVSEKAAASPIQAKPAQQVKVKPVPKPQPVLNEKDKAILDDVERIIWNPDRLKKLQNDGKARQGK
jgi:hypothetical protein